MMPYREMKTETLLLQPAENGWTAVHKKYKNCYGSLACEAEADGVRLTPTARMELDTVFANEKPCTPEDDMAMAVRCLSQLKRLWRL